MLPLQLTPNSFEMLNSKLNYNFNSKLHLLIIVTITCHSFIDKIIIWVSNNTPKERDGHEDHIPSINGGNFKLLLYSYRHDNDNRRCLTKNKEVMT